VHPKQAAKLATLEDAFTQAKRNEQSDPATYRTAKQRLAKYRIELRHKTQADAPDSDGDAVAATKTIKASTKDPRKKGT